MISRIAGHITVLWGWRRWLAAFFAGLLAAFSQAPFHIFPVLWIALPVIVWLMDGATDIDLRGRRRRLRPAAAIGWWFGFGYFLAGLWWIGRAFLVESDVFGWLIPIAVPALPAGLAIIWAVAFAFAGIFWRGGWTRILILAAALGAAEWVRGHVLTGFPWNTLGYALAGNTLFMQAAALVGIYGLTLIAVFVFAAPAVVATRSAPQRWSAAVTIAALAVFLAIPVYGTVRLFVLAPPLEIHDAVRLRIVQPAIAQEDKWQPENQGDIFKAYLDLSNRSTSPDRLGLVGVTHLIWPESALPFFLAETPAALAAIGKLLPPGTTLITGGVRAEAPLPGAKKRRVFNSIFVIGSDGGIVDAYDKVRLVPFGEYLPLQSILESFGLKQLTHLSGKFAVGHGGRPLAVPAIPAAEPLICYEAIFPGTRNRAEWLLNVTNDAWFGHTPGPYQHLHQARLRAVERGVPLIRAANTGISAIVDPYGRIVGKLDLGRRDVIDGTLPKSIAEPPYSRWGDWIFAVMLGTILLTSFLFRPRSTITG